MHTHTYAHGCILYLWERNSLDKMSQISGCGSESGSGCAIPEALRSAQWRDRSRTDLPASGGFLTKPQAPSPSPTPSWRTWARNWNRTEAMRCDTIPYDTIRYHTMRWTMSDEAHRNRTELNRTDLKWPLIFFFVDAATMTSLAGQPLNWISWVDSPPRSSFHGSKLNSIGWSQIASRPPDI